MKETVIAVASLVCLGSTPVFAEYQHSDGIAKEAEAPYQLGQMWRPDKGLMLMRGGVDEAAYVPEKNYETDGKIDNRRALVHGDKLDEFCLTLRLQQNFDYEDEQDGPAKFSWSHPAGGGDSWDVDASIRADLWIPGFYRPEGAEMSLALGYDMKRSETPTSEIDLQRFHVAVPFVVKGIPFLQDGDQVFQADFSYGVDDVSGEEGFDFETNYTPVFKLTQDAGWIGVPCSFRTGKALSTSTITQEPYYSFEPKVGLSYGEKYTLGSPIANLDGEFVFTYEVRVKLGWQLGRAEDDDEKNRLINAELNLALKGGDSFGDGGSFDSQEVSLELKPTLDSTVSLVIAYENGADSFSGTDSELTSVSLGWGF